MCTRFLHPLHPFLFSRNPPHSNPHLFSHITQSLRASIHHHPPRCRPCRHLHVLPYPYDLLFCPSTPTLIHTRLAPSFHFVLFLLLLHFHYHYYYDYCLSVWFCISTLLPVLIQNDAGLVDPPDLPNICLAHVTLVSLAPPLPLFLSLP